MSKILLEDKRTALLSRSKSGAPYVPWNQGFGKNRYARRLRSKLASSVKNFNNIDMNKFFKTDILDVSIDVAGETNSYLVRMSFTGVLDELHNQIKVGGEEAFNKKAIARALTRCFSKDDVYINCTCPDFHYRFKYWATRGNILVGDPELRPANITNPHNDKGPGCKHIALALSDSSWLIKVASVIYNYINYMEKTGNPRLYQKYIYPAIYQKPYENQQLSIFDDEDEVMSSDSDTIDTSNQAARERNRFKPGNEYRFKRFPDKNQVTLADLEDEENALDSE